MLEFIQQHYQFIYTPQHGETWFDIRNKLHLIEWQVSPISISDYRHDLYMQSGVTFYLPVKEQVYKAPNPFYQEADLLQPIEPELQRQRAIFLKQLADFKQVMQALADDPIKVDSGLEQPRKRKQIIILTHPRETLTHPRKVIMHPQRAYQDVKNDVANQLSGLPNFTARVKISENAPQNPGKKCLSCKLLNNPGAKFCIGCGKQLPAPNEYTLTTLKPIGGIGKAALQQRLTTIQGNNIQKGYVRERSTVEAEIIKRQTSCSSSSAPAQPQKPQPQPQYARQVPVQGHCPTCNATNPRGSKFCNQCGTKL